MGWYWRRIFTSIDAYIDIIKDGGPDIDPQQVTELWDTGNLQSDYNLDCWKFGVVYYNRDAYESGQTDLVLTSNIGKPKNGTSSRDYTTEKNGVVIPYSKTM